MACNPLLASRFPRTRIAYGPILLQHKRPQFENITFLKGETSAALARVVRLSKQKNEAIALELGVCRGVTNSSRTCTGVGRTIRGTIEKEDKPSRSRGSRGSPYCYFPFPVNEPSHLEQHMKQNISHSLSLSPHVSQCRRIPCLPCNSILQVTTANS